MDRKTPSGRGLSPYLVRRAHDSTQSGNSRRGDWRAAALRAPHPLTWNSSKGGGNRGPRAIGALGEFERPHLYMRTFPLGFALCMRAVCQYLRYELRPYEAFFCDPLNVTWTFLWGIHVGEGGPPEASVKPASAPGESPSGSPPRALPSLPSILRPFAETKAEARRPERRLQSQNPQTKRR